MVKTIEDGVPLSEYEFTIHFCKKNKVLTLEEANRIICEKMPSFQEISQAKELGDVHEVAYKLSLYMAVSKELNRRNFLRFVRRKGGRRSQRVKRE